MLWLFLLVLLTHVSGQAFVSEEDVEASCLILTFCTLHPTI